MRLLAELRGRRDKRRVLTRRSSQERFVRRAPLRRVHECVAGVLALESEPIDPRL
ncbi:MAG: hypothetical protein IT306_26800 [Chloroflexi bacterium]|nr:hypothetical protein [Chloroflexota bacterium]